MPETRLVLGQAFPAAATLTPLYTVPAATQAVVSTISVCNQSGTPATYSISVAIAGAADTPAQYLAFNAQIGGDTSWDYTIGATLGAADVIRCESSNGAISFVAFGVQLT